MVSMNNNINTNSPYRAIDKITGCLSYLPNGRGVYINQYIYLKEPKSMINASIFIKETTNGTYMECEANFFQINAGIQTFKYYNTKPNEYDSILANIENYLKTEGGIHINESGGESLETEELFWMNILNQSMIKIDEHVQVLIIK